MGISQRPGGYFYNAASALVKGFSLNLILAEAEVVEQWSQGCGARL